MTTGETRVSVVMPAVNSERHIASAIGSCLRQLSGDDELIVVDNASTDATARIVTSLPDPRIKYHHESRKGVAAARNTGLRQVQGQYVAFLDSDDLWPEGRQQGLMACLDANPDVDAAYGRLRVMDDGGIDPRSVKLDGALSPSISLCPFLFRRAIIGKAGEMDEAFFTGEDTDYLIRLTEAGMRTMPWDGDALIYRRHAGSMILQRKMNSKDMLQVLTGKIRRSRNEAP
jgi:glycosyltransferase involved in cell wall biosynthesis